MQRRKRPRPTLDAINDDGILGSMLSVLSLREAVRTSVLSRRWRHVWTHRRYLRFDSTTIPDPHPPCINHLHTLPRAEKLALIAQGADRFIESVDSVLRQYGSTGVEAILIAYFLHKIHADKLDAWVRFAVRSKTKRLDLNLSRTDYRYWSPSMEVDLYDFPCELFAKENDSPIENLSLECCTLRVPRDFDGLNYLKYLHLDQVSVSGEGIDHLLSNCFSLESLCVQRSPELVELKISHSLSRLKHLIVRTCPLKKVEIDARNLTKFEYSGHSVDFIFGESSRLTDAHINFVTNRKFDDMDFALAKLSKSMPHLESLFFKVNGCFKVADSPKSSISFIQLRHLVWSFWTMSSRSMSLLCLALFLNAAPMLEKLELWCLREPFKRIRKMRKLPNKCPHTHLKTVEISGFYGGQWQIEFALHLLNNAIELESMTIDPRDRKYPGSLNWHDSRSEINIPQEAKEYILRRAPENAKIVFL